MSHNVHETIIIGGGAAGLGCAKRLQENKQDFLLITENIGGRIYEADSDSVSYGAYYILKGYDHIRPYVRIKRRMRRSDMVFHKKNHSYTIWNKKLFTHFNELIKLELILKKFNRHYKRFKKQSAMVDQVLALKADPYLLELYNQNTLDFIKQNKIDNIVYDYMEEIIHGTAFTEIKNLNAFTFLWLSLPLVLPAYEFIFNKEKITDSFKYKIQLDTVNSVTKAKNTYIVKTNTDTYIASNIVMATPISETSKLIDLPEIKKPVNAHMFHIMGKIQPSWDHHETHGFDDKNRMLAIARQIDGTYIMYSKDKEPEFNKYFSEYKILKHKYWNPAFNVIGDQLLECKQDDGLYVIGEHNVCNLENCYITGIYAAKQIIYSENPAP